jgi:membrane-associated protease RseP (regulator of RpoE activity)
MSSGPLTPGTYRPTVVQPSSIEPSWNGGYRVGPPPRVVRKPKFWLHILLFVLTVWTTSAFGAVYSVCLMSILTAHEFGHYFAARYHRVQASLPYFIPLPAGFGTFGAVIRMSPYIPNRRALFDIAAAGPIAGLVIALPVVFIGIATSEYRAPDLEGAVILGDPLMFKVMEWIISGGRPEGTDLYLNEMAYAGWVGLFVTALNLLPIGQLDGGHVIYSVFAAKSRFVAATAFGGLALVTIFMSPAYILFVILLWFFRIKHPPTMNDYIPLDRPRQIIAAILLLVFILCFTPVPIVKMPF